MTTAELFTRRKEVLGLSDRELGRRMRTLAKPDGVSDVAVENWRKGKTRPTQIPPEVIAAALEVEASEVYSALGMVPEPEPGERGDARRASMERVVEAVERLAEPDLLSLLDYAEFLAARAELRSWSDRGSGALAQLYGDDEPEYSIADHRP